MSYRTLAVIALLAGPALAQAPPWPGDAFFVASSWDEAAVSYANGQQCVTVSFSIKGKPDDPNYIGYLYAIPDAESPDQGKVTLVATQTKGTGPAGADGYGGAGFCLSGYTPAPPPSPYDRTRTLPRATTGWWVMVRVTGPGCPDNDDQFGITTDWWWIPVPPPS